MTFVSPMPGIALSSQQAPSKYACNLFVPPYKTGKDGPYITWWERDQNTVLGTHTMSNTESLQQGVNCTISIIGFTSWFSPLGEKCGIEQKRQVLLSPPTAERNLTRTFSSQVPFAGYKMRGTRVGYYFAKSTDSCPSGKSLKDLSQALVKPLAGDFLNLSIFTQRR